MSRTLLIIGLCAVLIAPAATAHIQGARPILQRNERDRIVGLDPEGLELGIDLSLTGDSLRQIVSHEIDGPEGRFYVHHRADASRIEQTFYAEWRLDRLVEYRDLNVDGLYEPSTDTVIKSWPFAHYKWQRSEMRSVQVADVRADSTVWDGNLTGGPHIRMEVAAAGTNFTDEGAIVRPQDVAIYLEFSPLPTRGVGSLYALEGGVRVQPDTQLSLHVVENTTTAILADTSMRRALLVWGGEALVDGVEQRVDARLDEERLDDYGNKTARLTLHLPTADRSIRFVMVSGIEYGTENVRAPMVGAVAVLLAVALMAFLRRRNS